MCQTRRHVPHPRRKVLEKAFRDLRGEQQSSEHNALSWEEFLSLMQLALTPFEVSATGTATQFHAAPSRSLSSRLIPKPRPHIMAQYLDTDITAGSSYAKPHLVREKAALVELFALTRLLNYTVSGRQEASRTAYKKTA